MCRSQPGVSIPNDHHCDFHASSQTDSFVLYAYEYMLLFDNMNIYNMDLVASIDGIMATNNVVIIGTIIVESICNQSKKRTKLTGYLFQYNGLYILSI